MSAKKRKSTFVLVIPRFEDISHSYFAGEIIKGASLCASRLNTDILIHITDRTDHHGWLDSSLMDTRFVDGIIFGDIQNDVDIVKKAIGYGMPCMVLNNILHEPINYVAVNNKKAAVLVVEYFIQCGHKKIATITGDLSTQAGIRRLEGYREALLKHGIEVPRNYMTLGHFLRTPARLAAQKLLKLKDRPTAVFAASDVMALELVDVAKSLNIKIPEELSVIGFDDNPILTVGRDGLTAPFLTTVSQPLVEMGRLGAEHLGQICQGKAQLPVKIILPTKLIKRNSVAKI